MTQAPETALVAFHGHQLLTIKDGDTIRVAMKPICDAIGIDWTAQFRRIQRHPVMATCIAMTAIQMPGDDQRREVATLPLDMLNGWLFGVESSRVNPEIRDRLIEYQRECFAALAAYWQQGVATNPRARAATIPQLLATQRQLRGLVQDLKRETNPAVRRLLHVQIIQACRLLSIPAPALEEIGADAAPPHKDPRLADFWGAVDYLLRGSGAKLNHARDKRYIAINLYEVGAAASSAKLQIPPRSELCHLLRMSRSPQFIAVKTVNSPHHRVNSIKCWVFQVVDEPSPSELPVAAALSGGAAPAAASSSQ